MATLDNAAIIRELQKAWNEKDMDRFAALCAADGRMTNVAFGVKLPLREYAEGWARAFPDGQIEQVTIVAQGDCVVAECIGRGTHTGALRTPTGELAATGRKVEVPFVEIYRLKNGKITEGKMYFDGASMLQQLGLGQGAQAGQQRQTQPAPQPRH